jgi:hypothetical protein
VDYCAELAVQSVGLLALVPAVLCEDTIVDLDGAIKQFEHFLPSPELVTTEIFKYKSFYMRQPEDSRPSTCAAAMKAIDKLEYPNLAVLLQIACTLPVSSCECERSASVMRRLHTWMRSSMGQERLGSLALMHIHYDKVVDIDQVVGIFASKHARRMQLQCLFTE